MEILISVAYFFLVRLIFFDYKLLRFTLFWKFVVFGVWVGALLTEVILLGQFAPYSKEAFVQSYVVPMAPEWGGVVTEVYVKANAPVKKGDPLFQMDPQLRQFDVNQAAAALVGANTAVAELEQQLQEAQATVEQVTATLKEEKLKLAQIRQAAAASAASDLRLESSEQRVASLEAELKGAIAAQRLAEVALDSKIDGQPTIVAEANADLNKAQYNLEQTTIRAPSDGYVSNLQLHPGGYVRLKAPVMTFVDSEEHWVIAKARQNGMQRVAPGDKAELAFALYPGKIFEGVVESVAWATGNAQGVIGGRLPTEQQVAAPTEFVFRLRLTEQDPRYPLRFGASALVAVYTKDCPDFLKVLRQIELQGESFLNYLYNPF